MDLDRWIHPSEEDGEDLVPMPGEGLSRSACAPSWVGLLGPVAQCSEPKYHTVSKVVYSL